MTGGGVDATATTDRAASVALTAPLAAFVDDRDGHTAATRASQFASAASLSAASAALAAANAKSRRQLARTGPALLRAAALLRELRADLEYIHTHSRALETYVSERCPEAALGNAGLLGVAADRANDDDDKRQQQQQQQQRKIDEEEDDAIREEEEDDKDEKQAGND